MIHLLGDLTKLTTNQLIDIRKAMHILNADICCTNCKQCTNQGKCEAINAIADKVLSEIDRRKQHTYGFTTKVKQGYNLDQYILEHATDKMYDIAHINNCIALVIGNNWFNLVNVTITDDTVHFEFKYYEGN